MASLLRKYGTFLATAVVCAALYVAAGLLYEGFFAPGVLTGFFTDNAFLGIAAIGVTFVILSGGIDLSVALLGTTMGSLIHFFRLPPFIVTLAGMFFARGLGFVVNQESIAIRHGFYESLAGLPAVIFLLVLAAGICVAHWTRFGRNTYAVGGNEESALLMGLPVGRTKIGVYALSGLCSALAGAVYTLYTFSGNPTAGMMLELDAIAATVIGGTLLTGGVGYVAGALLGVLIFGIIQTAIIFDGRLSSWWTRIAIGILLLAFILLQRLLQRTIGKADNRDERLVNTPA
ncbi:MAG: ABC transporter permease subunit [Planctomycetota bacterium]